MPADSLMISIKGTKIFMSRWWNYWRRKGHQGISDSGWDSEMVNYPHVFELDGKSYMLYQGNGMGRAGFGLAVLESESSWCHQ